ncbi:MAG: addiction module antidote protein [Hyphomonadaceae bacterium]|nr:MAG: addiction module antidote protein [Hyphomonadaceae bacterium]KAF0185057.1 MAG: addiction module antidote protein [Hyphomonadaceae bacterium]
MAMVKKSITLTTQQDNWIKSHIISGHYGNESEILRELIRERQAREQEGTNEIESIRAALIEAENSGFENVSLKEIWQRARNKA